MELLFELIVGHALGDFVLQSDTMAKQKNPNYRSPEGLERIPGFPPWYYWMGAHALVHGGLVYGFAGFWQMGVLEALVHFVIDYAKCQRLISFHQDQALHIACKISYASYIAYLVGPN